MVDSIGGSSRDPAYETRLKQLEAERVRELEKIEARNKQNIAKASEAREAQVARIYEDTSGEVETRRRDADERIAMAAADADARVRSFEDEAARMTDSARRQFQTKANALAKTAQEFEKQREYLMKQHAGTMEQLHKQREERILESKNKSNIEVSNAHLDLQRNLDDIQKKGEIDMVRLRNEYADRKRGEIAQGERELAQIQGDRADRYASVAQEIEFAKKSMNQQMQNERQRNEANMLAQQAEFEARTGEMTREAQGKINRVHIEGKKSLTNAHDQYAQQLEDSKKQNERQYLDQQVKASVAMQQLHSAAKVEEDIAKKNYDTKKQLLHEQRTQTLSQYADQNSKLQDHLNKEYHYNSARLTDDKNRMIAAQYGQDQKEIQFQRKFGNKLINDQIANNSRALGAYSSKEGDPFYQLQKLAARVSDTPEQLVVEMNVPEHEQESLKMTEQPGKVTISGTRRAERKAKSEDGHTSATNTYQTYNETIPVKGKLDMKRMARSYDAGKLTFRVPKV